ncbi:MAG: SAF domain-containing protein [Microthrixaceae bacterium]
MSQRSAHNRLLAVGLSNALRQLANRLARCRSRLEQSSLARRVLATRLLVLLIALTVGWQVRSQLLAARSAQASWGISGEVFVATRPLKPGEVLDSSSVRQDKMPVRFIPPSALIKFPVDRRAKVAIAAGEILLSSRIAAPGTGALGATLMPQTQAVTISLGEAPAPLQVGDIVDVLSVATQGLSLDADSGLDTQTRDAVLAQRVARSAEVLQVSQGQTTLAVRTVQVDALVSAAATTPISLVILE